VTGFPPPVGGGPKRTCPVPGWGNGSVTSCPQPWGRRGGGYHRPMAVEAGTLQEQLEEIRTQLAWVRDYL